jgi:hypothetical protein
MKSNKKMRSATIMAIAASLLLGACSGGRAPFCARTAEYTSCTYYTLESCRAALSADRGSCDPNPGYRPR